MRSGFVKHVNLKGYVVAVLPLVLNILAKVLSLLWFKKYYNNNITNGNI